MEIILFRFYKLRGAVAERLRKSYHANPDSEHPICSVLGSQLSAQIPDLKHSPPASELSIEKGTGPQEKKLPVTYAKLVPGPGQAPKDLHKANLSGPKVPIGQVYMANCIASYRFHVKGKI